MSRRPASLRLRAVVAGLVALIISLGLVGLALDAAYQRSSEGDLRQQMETWVYLVLAATETGRTGELRVAREPGDPLLVQPGSGVYAHLHYADGHWSSPSALGREMPELPAAAPGAILFEDLTANGGFYALRYGLAWELPDASLLPFTVSILVDPKWLAPEIMAFRAGLWRSLGAAGLILAIAQWLFFSLSLRPLRKVAGDVAAIEQGRAESLDGPYSRELEPLTRNLDRLLATEKANQAHYRNALDSLAHSLKTPLAVIRAGLQGGGDRDRRAIESAVDDMQQLIASRLQRAAASTRRALVAPCAVQPVAERLAESLRKVHSQVLHTLDVNMEVGLQFYGEERDLMELLGNLMDNACKYGGGTVRVSGGVLDGDQPRPGLWLAVENDGEPVPPSRLEAMSQRGVRGDERVEGHGLGLTIVSEIVNAYGGEVTFADSELGGTRVNVKLPPA